MNVLVGMIVAVMILLLCVGFGLAVFQIVVWIFGDGGY